MTDRQIGVGPTTELSLRVSVGTIVRVLFADPESGRTMLALERNATLREGVPGPPSEVTVRAKPFGGGVRILDPRSLQLRIGDFNYDSERSRHEEDFRIQVSPSAWSIVKEICREQLMANERPVIDYSPERELAEEFRDSLNLDIGPAQYTLAPAGMVVEDQPTKTENVRAPGIQTVRVYYVFEAWLRDPAIVANILANSAENSDADLELSARIDADRGGKGRANAVLAVSLDDLVDAYRTIAVEKRGEQIRFGRHVLDGNVLAILDGVEQMKYHVFTAPGRRPA